MRSPRDRLTDAIVAWIHDDARETLGRLRGDPDASPPRVVLERHAALRGPRVKEHFMESVERGQLEPSERARLARWLHEAHAAVGRARAADRIDAAWSAPIPHDSDHLAPADVLDRGLRASDRKTRALAGRSLVPFFERLHAAQREGLADVEEAAERGEWVLEWVEGDSGSDSASDSGSASDSDSGSDSASDSGSASDSDSGSDSGSGSASDSGSDSESGSGSESAWSSGSGRGTGTGRGMGGGAGAFEAWQELVGRVGHAVGGIEDWIDLLHALRAPELDDLFDPARRFRRLAQRFDGIGGREVLSARARVVQPARAGVRGARVLALDVPRQVRLVPGHELGLASERDAALTMGRALAIAWTHPALPTLEAWPRGETVGRALGGLFAHLGASPEQLEREGGLASRERRLVAERALALDVFSLLTRGACAEVRPHLGERSGQERAETALREAWGVELPPALAACLTAHLGPHPDAAARAERWVAPLFLALRERYDEDWWRNPRSAEPLRAACERGPSLEIEAWAEELDAPADGWARRLRERL